MATRESTSSNVSDHPFLVSFIPLNSNGQNRRIVNLETPVPIGRLLDRDEPVVTNLKFASKVVSRQHATMTYSDGKLWVQDTKSSSGTFLNGKRMSPQGQESARLEVHDGDTIRLGEDCEVNGVIHQSVVLKVIFGKAGFRDRLSSHDSSLDLSRYENSENMNDQYVDFSMDPQVQASVDAEFNLIWSSLTQGLDHPLKRLRDFSRAKAAGHTNAIMPRTSVGSSHVLNSYNPRTSHPGSRRPSMSRSDTAIPENEPVTTFDSRSRTTSFTSLSSVGTAHAPLVVTVSQSGHRSISPTLMTALPPDQLPWASPPLASEDM